MHNHRRNTGLPWCALWWQFADERVRRCSRRCPHYDNLCTSFIHSFVLGYLFIYWFICISSICRAKANTVNQTRQRGPAAALCCLTTRRVMNMPPWPTCKKYISPCDNHTNYSSAITSDGEANGVLFLTLVAGHREGLSRAGRRMMEPGKMIHLCRMNYKLSTCIISDSLDDD